PPKKKLDAADVEVLAQWVKRGAPWPADTVARPAERSFWSFPSVRPVTPPAVADTAWARNPIDRFLLARLDARNLRPPSPADRRRPDARPHPSGNDRPHRGDGLPGRHAPLRVVRGQKIPVVSDLRGQHRKPGTNGPGSGPGMCPLPRSQVRPDLDGGLLRAV